MAAGLLRNNHMRVHSQQLGCRGCIWAPIQAASATAACLLPLLLVPLLLLRMPELLLMASLPCSKCLCIMRVATTTTTTILTMSGWLWAVRVRGGEEMRLG